MGQSHTTAPSTGNPSKEKADGHPNLMADGLRNFTSYFSQNVGEYVKVGSLPSF